MVVIVIVIYGGDIIEMKKNGIDNKNVEIIKDLNKLINWVMDCGNWKWNDWKWNICEKEHFIKNVIMTLKLLFELNIL